MATTTANTTQVTPERLAQIAWSYVPPLVIEAAIHHRIFDALDNNGPMNVWEVQEATGASARGLAAIMNVLTGLNLLAKEDGRYALTPESETFLVSSKPGFQGGIFRHCSQHLIPRWLNLNDVVTTGKPVTPVNQEQTGGGFFHDFVMDIFPMSYPAAQALAGEMDFGSSQEPVKVLDLAAGSGVWGIALAQSSPQVQVTAVDWPEVIPVTKKSVERFTDIADRFSFIEGDLHDVDFGSGYTLATLGHILHSEGEGLGRKLLAKTYDALASGGTIAIAEFLVNEERTGPLNGLFFAVNMLVNTQNGNTWSFEEIAAWLEEAGFDNPRTVPSPGPSPLILATKL